MATLTEHSSVAPPSSTAQVHSVIERGYQELERLLTEQREVIAEAQTAAEVDASNPPVRVVLDAVLQYGPLLDSEGYCAGGKGGGPATRSPSRPRNQRGCKLSPLLAGWQPSGGCGGGRARARRARPCAAARCAA